MDPLARHSSRSSSWWCFSAPAARAAASSNFSYMSCASSGVKMLTGAKDARGVLLTLLTFYSNENDYCQGSSVARGLETFPARI